MSFVCAAGEKKVKRQLLFLHISASDNSLRFPMLEAGGHYTAMKYTFVKVD